MGMIIKSGVVFMCGPLVTLLFKILHTGLYCIQNTHGLLLVTVESFR